MRRFIIWLFFIMVTPVSVFAAQDSDQLVILTEEYPPFNYMENGTISGTATEIVLEILERIGSKLTLDDIRLIPWARSYKELLLTKNTVLYSIVRSEHREKLFKWVCPVGCNTVGIIARKRDRVVIEKPEDYEKYRIGVVREDIGHQLMRKLIPEQDLDITNSSESNLLKLKEGRIDMFPYDVAVADYVLAKLGLVPSDYEVVSVLDQSPLCIAFNKDTDDAIIEAFQEALDEIIKERPINICQ